MNVHPDLYDAVALLKNIPAQRLAKGQVGAIVMDYGGGNFEIEFVDRSGHTIAVATLNESEFLVLHYEAELV